MSTTLDTTQLATTTVAGRARKRRGLMKLAGGAAVAAILAAGCAPSDRDAASSSASSAQPSTSLAAGDTSNGADNFYTSDRVTVQKVTFKNQYQMNVVGNLFVPKDLDRNTKHAGDRRRPSDGRGEGAEREPLRHEDGRAGLRHPVPGPVVLGRERGPAAQRGGPRHLRRGLQRRGRLPGHPALRRHANGSARSAICGSGSFVISAAKIDPRMKAIATVSMYDMGAANRERAAAIASPSSSASRSSRQAAEQRDVEFAGGETKYTGGTPDELTDQSTPIEREFYDFYRTPRGTSARTTDARRTRRSPAT